MGWASGQPENSLEESSGPESLTSPLLLPCMATPRPVLLPHLNPGLWGGLTCQQIAKARCVGKKCTGEKQTKQKPSHSKITNISLFLRVLSLDKKRERSVSTACVSRTTIILLRCLCKLVVCRDLCGGQEDAPGY